LLLTINENWATDNELMNHDFVSNSLLLLLHVGLLLAYCLWMEWTNWNWNWRL